MAKTHLKAGAELDVLTRDELAETIGKGTRTWFQEKARGVSSARFSGAAAVASSAISLPATGDNAYGPKPGFAWRVERMFAAGLATNDVLKVYRNATTDLNQVAQLTAAAPMQTFGKGLILRAEEKLLITGASLGATGFVSVNGEAVEVAETDVYKLI